MIEACKLIGQMEISQQNQDLRQGDLYEYLLSLQEEFAPFVSLRGSATGVVARVESLRGEDVRGREAGQWVV